MRVQTYLFFFYYGFKICECYKQVAIFEWLCIKMKYAKPLESLAYHVVNKLVIT